MRYLLALMVFLIGLEGVDRALLERGMASLKPPREPAALRALVNPPDVPPPPPPPPSLPAIPGDAAMFP